MVYDTQDVRSLLPLTGLERLSFSFNTPGLPGYDMTEDNGVPFHIYKVDTIRKDTSNDIGQFYKIFFCSPCHYLLISFKNSSSNAGKYCGNNILICLFSSCNLLSYSILDTD